MSAPARFKSLSLDAVDHQRLADWWCTVLGYQRRHLDTAEWPEEWPLPIHDPSGHGPTLWFNPVPEPTAGGNRVRLDVRADTEELLELGATLVRPRDDTSTKWDLLADPEGNTFLVFPPRPVRPVTANPR